MFSGLIDDIGKVKKIKNSLESTTITIQSQVLKDKSSIGDTISTNGVCLKVISKLKDGIEANVLSDIFKNTNLRYLKNGDLVNLESPKSPGGNKVHGHIETTGKIVNILKSESVETIIVAVDEPCDKCFANHKFVAIDGVSIDVSDINQNFFAFSFLPLTSIRTTLLTKKIGDLVNIECEETPSKYNLFVKDLKTNLPKNIY